MPTGYTSRIADGISFEDFVLSCSRAFGALITLRDEPDSVQIPDEIIPSNYHLNALEEAEASLRRFKAMSFAMAIVEVEESYRNEMSRRKEYLAKNTLLLKKYQVMLDKVKEWQPPTPDHEGLKKFMIDQITESIKFDCRNIYSERLVKSTPEEYLATMISGAKCDIEYHKKEWKNEVKRCAERTKWIKDLKQSLKKG